MDKNLCEPGTPNFFQALQTLDQSHGGDEELSDIDSPHFSRQLLPFSFAIVISRRGWSPPCVLSSSLFFSPPNEAFTTTESILRRRTKSLFMKPYRKLKKIRQWKQWEDDIATDNYDTRHGIISLTFNTNSQHLLYRNY
ncbi:hypothetical protein ACS0TY_021310 [Phlomoides rotata]